MVESRYRDNEQIVEDAQKILDFIDQETEAETENDVDMLLQACWGRQRNVPQPKGPRSETPDSGGSLDYVQ